MSTHQGHRPPPVKRDATGASGSGSAHQPLFAVVVYDDDQHAFPEVIEALRRVCGHSRSRAYRLVQRIHSSGRAAVWTGVREVAELKQEQLIDFRPTSRRAVSATAPRRPRAWKPLRVSVEPGPDEIPRSRTAGSAP